MKGITLSPKFKKKFRNIDLIFFLGPYMAVFFIFTILPVIVAYILAFTQFDSLQMPVWVGLQNYERLFLEEQYFGIALQNSFILASLSGPLNYFVAFIFAWILNEVPPKPRTVLTLLFYIPSMVGGFQFLLDLLLSQDKYGWINGWLIQLGFIDEPLQFAKMTDIMIPLAVIIMLWNALGQQFLIFISSLQGVDKSLYEAGAVDGISNRWQELYYITLPAIKGQLALNAILTITSAVAIVAPAYFGNPTQDYRLYTLQMMVNDYTSRLELGYVTAMSSIMFVISLTVNKIVQYLIGKIGT